LGIATEKDARIDLVYFAEFAECPNRDVMHSALYLAQVLGVTPSNSAASFCLILLKS
jgi:hypothetical protein